MAILRQQRATRNRRALTRARPALLPRLIAQLDSVGSNTATFTFTLWPVPPNTPDTGQKVVLQGTPQIRRIATGDYPSAVELINDGTTLLVTYPGDPLTGADTFVLGASDPAIRTAVGGTVGATVTSAAYSPPMPVPYIATATGPNEITLTRDGVGTWDIYARNDAWVGVSPSNTVLSVTITAFAAVLSMAGAVSAGDSVAYAGGAISGLTFTAFSPAPGEVIVG